MTIEHKDFSIEEMQEAAVWLQQGIDAVWITVGFCYTHDGDPYMTAEEEQEWEEGGDPCSPVVKWLV
jgi:hypothetical protein